MCPWRFDMLSGLHTCVAPSAGQLTSNFQTLSGRAYLPGEQSVHAVAADPTFEDPAFENVVQK